MPGVFWVPVKPTPGYVSVLRMVDTKPLAQASKRTRNSGAPATAVATDNKRSNTLAATPACSPGGQVIQVGLGTGMRMGLIAHCVLVVPS